MMHIVCSLFLCQSEMNNGANNIRTLMANFIIVDDHPLARLAIRIMLENAGHHIVAESEMAEGVERLILQHDVSALIIDIGLPGMTGIELIAALRNAGVQLPVIVMSGKDPGYYSAESIKAGANGFISKKNHMNDLLQAVHAVFSGYGYFPLRMQESSGISRLKSDAERIRLLSRREREVLKLLSQGKEIIYIAHQLQISNKTVSTYKARLMEKLGLKNQRDLLEFSRRNRIG